MKESELIAAAQSLIDTPQKWVKGTYYCLEGGVERYCILGALQEVQMDDERLFDTGQYESTKARIVKAINEQFPERTVISPHEFNDHRETTHAEVMAVMTKARIAAEEAGK